jgi:Tfp pilus assembly protein PilN
MAQDFRAAFGFGENDTTLNTVDTNGVTMAAIQGLYQMMQEKEQRNLELAREVEELRSRLAQLERVMNERAAEKR